MPILHWLTREQDLHTARKAPYRLLEEVQTHGEADTRNMIIQGDNLDALKALLPYYAGKVKCIYIDPPYNTRSAFEPGHTDEAKKENNVLFGADDAFTTPKPERLIQRILHIATNPGDLVLDSFLGSGTTAFRACTMSWKANKTAYSRPPTGRAAGVFTSIVWGNPFWPKMAPSALASPYSAPHGCF